MIQNSKQEESLALGALPLSFLMLKCLGMMELLASFSGETPAQGCSQTYHSAPPAQLRLLDRMQPLQPQPRDAQSPGVLLAASLEHGPC